MNTTTDQPGLFNPEDNSFMAKIESSAASISNMMDEVTTIAQNWIRVRQEISAVEDKLKELYAQERKISMEILPSIFAQHKMTKLLLNNGIEISVKEDLDAGIPAEEEKAEKCFKWLSANGGGDLVKDSLIIYDPPKSVVDQIVDNRCDFDRARKVNVNSLKAWLRGELGMKEKTIARIKADDVPPEMRLFRYTKAKMKGEK